MRSFLFVLFTSWFVLQGTAAAETSWALGLKAGTTGLGVEASYPLNDMFNLRAGVSGFALSRDFTEEGIKYDANVRLLSANLLADWHPFRGSFRLSAGGVLNFNQVEGKASGDLLIDDTTYPASLTATVDWNMFAPYIGLGWGNAVRRGPVSWMTDFGVVFTGSPNVKLKGTVNNSSMQAAFDNDLRREEAALKSQLKDLSFFPVASVGLSFRF